MSRILVTGMSGTGKSAVLAELGRRGHRVVDTDDPGWADEVTSSDPAGVEQLWREDRMTALLAEEADLFVAGCAANQGRFYDRFDAVALLSVPVEVMLQRLATRTTNPFGRTPADRARILADRELVEPLLRRSATVEIVTDQPLALVADAVQALSRRRA